MSDYIRKAVELADGWETLPGHWFSSPRDGQRAFHEIEQWELDALAAQLVRQVDAFNGKYLLISGNDECHIGDEVLAAIANERGPDRTMNTIKAIVDSGVLSTEGRE